MKKASTLFLLFLFTMTTFSQQAPQNQTITKTDYLKKSKTQKKIGYVLLAGGGAFIIADFAILGDKLKITHTKK